MAHNTPWNGSLSMNLATLNDSELDALRIDVLNEQERRAGLATIPQTVADLAARFIAGGGEQSVIEAAVVPA